MPLLKGDRFTTDSWIRSGDASCPYPATSWSRSPGCCRTGARSPVIPALSGWCSPHRAGSRRLVVSRPPVADRAAVPRLHRWSSLFDRPPAARSRLCGELRAVGNVLPDQLQFMLQVGFDAFEVPDRFPESVWQKAARSMSVTYQQVPGARNVWRARHGEAGSDRDDQDPWFEQPHAG